MEFYDLQAKIKSKDISLIFPQWSEGSEQVVIFSPHDDDVILGAGYALLSCLANKGEVYIVIFNDGSAGYSKPELKGKIVEIRKQETYNALKKLGIIEDNIIRFEIPDYTGLQYLGWKLPWNQGNTKSNEGLFSKVVSTLREIKATRLIFPNGYREHIDHTAVCLSAMYDGPQVGDAVIVDYGHPSRIKSFLQYSVWGKFSPEDSIINQRSKTIRANRAIAVDRGTEQKVEGALAEFKTQQEIISDILKIRKNRKLDNDDKYIELYLDSDPRPRFDYRPYKRLISEIDKE
jgi:LmbE family N-acetylglucosaminyl deacetylase